MSLSSIFTPLFSTCILQQIAASDHHNSGGECTNSDTGPQSKQTSEVIQIADRPESWIRTLSQNIQIADYVAKHPSALDEEQPTTSQESIGLSRRNPPLCPVTKHYAPPLFYLYLLTSRPPVSLLCRISPHKKQNRIEYDSVH